MKYGFPSSYKEMSRESPGLHPASPNVNIVSVVQYQYQESDTGTIHRAGSDSSFVIYNFLKIIQFRNYLFTIILEHIFFIPLPKYLLSLQLFRHHCSEIKGPPLLCS